MWRNPTARAAALAILVLAFHPSGLPAQTIGARSEASQQTSLAENPAETMAVIARLLRRDANRVTMQVDTQVITQGDVADYIAAMPPRMASLGYEGVFGMAVEALGRQKIMLIEALKQGLEKDPAVRHKFAIISEKILIDAWLAGKTEDASSEPKLRARYEQEVAGKPGHDEVRARIIVVATDAEARTLIVSLKNGADFGDLARAKSQDPTAGRGGDLGFVSRDAVPPEVAAVMFAQGIGEINAFPVPIATGYCVLRIEGRRQGVAPKFEDLRESLENAVRAAMVRDIVTNITNDAKIVVPAALPSLTAPSRP